METSRLVAESGKLRFKKTGKISADFPLGKQGLLGKSVGDVAEISVPNGVPKI
jgi:transcription elongation factor GreA